MNTPSKFDLTVLIERYRQAVSAHREAVSSITYKVSGGPRFGAISEGMLADYERTRTALLEIETELQDATLSRRSVR